MKIDELSIDIKANLNIDRKTAETCLKIVELYSEQNGIRVMCYEDEYGSHTFYFDDANIPIIHGKYELEEHDKKIREKEYELLIKRLNKMNLISLDDSVKVFKNLVFNHSGWEKFDFSNEQDMEWLRSEFEQKVQVFMSDKGDDDDTTEC